MKSNFTIAGFGLLTAAILISSFHSTTVSNNQGAPAGNTGSPFDNKTCARSGCHAGTATSLAGIITSTVPPTGYVPGTTYTITCSCSQPGISKWGFQVSPMNNSGGLLGSLIITNTLTTKLTGGKYVTHTSGGTAGLNSKTWTFNWVAPVAGTGNVTFYGAFNFANNNGNATGDIIRTSTMTIPESTLNTIDDLQNSLSSAKILQNPFQNQITISLAIDHSKSIAISVFGLSGQLISHQAFSQYLPGEHTLSIPVGTSYSRGLYLVVLQSEQETKVLKAIRN